MRAACTVSACVLSSLCRYGSHFRVRDAPANHKPQNTLLFWHVWYVHCTPEANEQTEDRHFNLWPPYELCQALVCVPCLLLPSLLFVCCLNGIRLWFVSRVWFLPRLVCVVCKSPGYFDYVIGLYICTSAWTDSLKWLFLHSMFDIRTCICPHALHMTECFTKKWMQIKCCTSSSCDKAHQHLRFEAVLYGGMGQNYSKPASNVSLNKGNQLEHLIHLFINSFSILYLFLK